MKWWQRIFYYLLVGSSKLIGLLPSQFLYRGLGGAIYFLLYRMIGYRTRIVRENLKNSFPEKSEDERREIKRKFYRNLAELFVDTVIMCSLSREELKRRFVIENLAEHEAEVADKSWICAMAHFGTWEYTSSYGMLTDHTVYGVYHPLHNRVMDEFLKYTRTRFGSKVLPMQDVARQIIKSNRAGEKFVLALISDQTPHYFDIHRWYDFLNQKTGFFAGTEKLALKFRLPVYFLNVERAGTAHYRCRFEKIYDPAEQVAEHEITERYAARLEQMIRRSPENWLWSHKRWKHKKLFSEKKQERRLGIDI